MHQIQQHTSPNRVVMIRLQQI